MSDLARRFTRMATGGFVRDRAVPPVFPMDVLKGPAESMMFGGVRVEERG